MGRGNGSYRRTILELVLVTGIFAIVSVFLIQFYMKADRLQSKAVAVSSATIRAESLAENVKAKGIAETAKEFGMTEKDGYYILNFDKKWQVTGDNAAYQMILTEPTEADRSGDVATVSILIGENGLEKQLGENAESDEDIVYCSLKVGYISEKEAQ